MPKGSDALTNARKREIINACASLYESMSFKEITLRHISEKTSFSRPSIYNYFQTKEEIFLALLRREHEEWIDDLRELSKEPPSLSAEEFSDKLARTLEKRGCMLKLMSMNLYDMEVNSRLENLVDFKHAYTAAFQTIGNCLEKCFPQMGAENIQKFLYAFFPFLFGVYPYTSHTEKQLKAMELAHVQYTQYSVYEIVKSFVSQMLRPFADEHPQKSADKREKN